MTIIGEPTGVRPAYPAGILSSVTDLIGNTPIVELHNLTTGLNCRVLVKLESRNPGGSSKDRIALNLIRTAEADGSLLPGATIVESSSGNTGIGLALVGRLTGHPVIIIHSAFISDEKRALLTAYGAELVEADWEAGPENPQNARAIADRIAAEIPNAWRSSQYVNEANPEAHFRTTGPEIWDQTGGTVTHFVAGIGTGGTVTGTGRFLKLVSEGAVRVVGANPVGSTYGGAEASTIIVDGVGTRWPESNWPSIFDKNVTDEIVTIADAVVYDTVRRLAVEESLLLGPSSGLAVAAALQVAATAHEGSVIVVIAPDGGGNYLSKAYNNNWLETADVNADGFADGSGD
ncbi:PLP-dependent cysteine synthase family protein [Conyzicola sp.]|uniref:PLP-dependent cysteine synthase family protein n=1 Tax=Conyzicola sp. TaxID=1969404 RepID=UPI003988C719